MIYWLYIRVFKNRHKVFSIWVLFLFISRWFAAGSGALISRAKKNSSRSKRWWPPFPCSSALCSIAMDSVVRSGSGTFSFFFCFFSFYFWCLVACLLRLTAFDNGSNDSMADGFRRNEGEWALKRVFFLPRFQCLSAVQKCNFLKKFTMSGAKRVENQQRVSSVIDDLLMMWHKEWVKKVCDWNSWKDSLPWLDWHCWPSQLVVFLAHFPVFPV